MSKTQHRLHFRDQLLVPAVWMLGGGCWVAQLFVPWTSVGILSASSQLDGFRLLADGSVDSIVPTWIAYLLLVLPGVGLVLIGTAFIDGGLSRWTRVVAGGVGCVALVATLHGLTAWDVGRMGPGAWATVIGAALVIGAAASDLLSPPRTSKLLEASA